MAKRDDYDVLGIKKGADASEIKRAYRKAAKKYHPDINKEKNAETKFKEINEANEVLSDETKRRQYDQFGHAGMNQQGGGQGGFGGFGGFSGGFNAEDIFSQFFGGGQRKANNPKRERGADKFMQMDITLEDAVLGSTITINLNQDKQCTFCRGTGADNPADVKTCGTCGGSGRIMTRQRTPFGDITREGICNTCGGDGKIIKRKCKKCRGTGIIHESKPLEVKIPAGIMSGQQLRISKRGEVNPTNGSIGDLFLEIRVKRHRHYEREGSTLYTSINIDYIDAVLGKQQEIETLYGKATFIIKPGTIHGARYKIKGKGAKTLRNSFVGDLIVIVEIAIPKSVSKKEKKLLQEIKKIKKG